MHLIKNEEYHHLMKIRVYYQDQNQWLLRPESRLGGAQINGKGEYTFRGDINAFARYLQKIKAKDNETDPPSSRGKTYLNIAQEIMDGIDPYIYVWNNKWIRNFRPHHEATDWRKKEPFVLKIIGKKDGEIRGYMTPEELKKSMGVSFNRHLSNLIKDINNDPNVEFKVELILGSEIKDSLFSKRKKEHILITIENKMKKIKEDENSKFTVMEDSMKEIKEDEDRFLLSAQSRGKKYIINVYQRPDGGYKIEETRAGKLAGGSMLNTKESVIAKLVNTIYFAHTWDSVDYSIIEGNMRGEVALYFNPKSKMLMILSIDDPRVRANIDQVDVMELNIDFKEIISKIGTYEDTKKSMEDSMKEIKEGKYGIDLTFERSGPWIIITDDNDNSISMDDVQWEYEKENFGLSSEEIEMIEKGHQVYVKDAVGIDTWGMMHESTKKTKGKIMKKFKNSKLIPITKPVVIEGYIAEPGDKISIQEWGAPGDIEVYVDLSYSNDFEIFDQMVRKSGLNWDQYNEYEVADYKVYEFDKIDYEKYIAPIIPKFNQVAKYDATIEIVPRGGQFY